jgi:hypothetical protein
LLIWEIRHSSKTRQSTIFTKNLLWAVEAVKNVWMVHFFIHFYQKKITFIVPIYAIFIRFPTVFTVYSDPSMQRRRNGIYVAYTGRILRENIYAWILRQMFLQRKWRNCKCFTDQWCTGISRLWNATGNIIMINLFTLN